MNWPSFCFGFASAFALSALVGWLAMLTAKRLPYDDDLPHARGTVPEGDPFPEDAAPNLPDEPTLYVIETDGTYRLGRSSYRR